MTSTWRPPAVWRISWTTRNCPFCRARPRLTASPLCQCRKSPGTCPARSRRRLHRTVHRPGHRAAACAQAAGHPRLARLPGPCLPHQPLGLRLHRRLTRWRDDAPAGRQARGHHRHRRHRGAGRAAPGARCQGAVRGSAHTKLGGRARQRADRPGLVCGCGHAPARRSHRRPCMHALAARHVGARLSQRLFRAAHAGRQSDLQHAAQAHRGWPHQPISGAGATARE